MKNTIIIIIFSAILLCCKPQVDITPQILLETTNAASSTGSAIVKVMGTAGGSLNIPTAGAIITVPAGAMDANATLSVTPTKDALDDTGEGLRISGSWTKPISVEFRINDPELGNYRLYAKMPNGLWVSSNKTKVIGNTVTVRLGPNSGTSIKNGKIKAKQYDLAFAKDFYLKPNGANLDLGQTETFTAYTNAGVVPYKYKGSDGKTHYVLDDDEPLAPLAPYSKSYYDDEIVPLAPYTNKYVDDDDIVPLARNTSIKDDDEIAPLAIRIEGYVLKNTKAGFTRKWETGTDVGKIDQNGKFTAVTDPAAKGRSTKVIFTSINDKTKQTIVASATVSIKDGIARYAGTFNFESIYELNDPSPAYPTNTMTIIERETGKVNLKAIVNEPDRYVMDLSKDNEASLTFYSLNSNRVASTGKNETQNRTLTTPTSAEWGKYDINSIVNPLIFNSDNTYRMRIQIPTAKGRYNTTIKYENGSTSTNSVDLTHIIKFSTSQTFNNDNIKNTDPDLLKGEKTWKSEQKDASSGKVIGITTSTAKWEFKKVQ